MFLAYICIKFNCKLTSVPYLFLAVRKLEHGPADSDWWRQ